MRCIRYATSVRSTKHSEAAYYLENYPDTDCPNRRNMCDESYKKHSDSSSWK